MAESIPKAIYVTYTGPEAFFMHSGRSRAAKTHPYRFIPKKPIRITEKEDIEFFWKNKTRFQHFLVTSKKPSEKAINSVDNTTTVTTTTGGNV